ncbi:MAG: DUF2188 domain-containing protein [Gemmatimonadaceae bacterium]
MHVVPAKSQRGFVVKLGGWQRPVFGPAARRAAIAYAIPMAVRRHCEVVVHRVREQRW